MDIFLPQEEKYGCLNFNQCKSIFMVINFVKYCAVHN